MIQDGPIRLKELVGQNFRCDIFVTLFADYKRERSSMSDQEWVEESDRRTEERLERRNASRTSKGRRRDLLERPIGRRAAHPLLKELADFLGGRLEQKPDLPPRWLDSEI